MIFGVYAATIPFAEEKAVIQLFIQFLQSPRSYSGIVFGSIWRDIADIRRWTVLNNFV